MKKKAYPITNLTRGLDVSLDPLFLTDQASPNLDFVRFSEGLLKKALGFSTYGNTLDARPMAFYNYEQADGDQWLIAVSVDDVRKYNTGTKEFDAIQVDAFTGDEDDLVYMVTMNNLLIITNGKDAVKEWNGATFTALGGMSAPIYLAKSLLVFNNYLLLINTDEAGTATPYRVRWSDTGDPEEYATGNSGFFDLLDTDDPCMCGALREDKAYVFKQDTIWEILYVGGTDIFKPRIVSDKIGTYAPRTVQSTGKELIFLGTDNIYMFDGVVFEPIGNEILPLLFDPSKRIMNQLRVNRAVGKFSHWTQEYYLSIPTGGDNPDLLLTWDKKDRTWTRRSQDCVCFGEASAPTRDIWTDWSSAWNSGDYAFPWVKQALPPDSKTTIFALSTGVVKEDDKVTKSTAQLIWESKDFIFAHASRIVEIRVQAKGDPFDISYSLNSGLSWSSEETLTPDVNDFSEVSIPINLTTQKIRVRIRTTGENLEIQWLEPWYIPRKRSKSLN